MATVLTPWPVGWGQTKQRNVVRRRRTRSLFSYNRISAIWDITALWEGTVRVFLQVERAAWDGVIRAPAATTSNNVTLYDVFDEERT